MSMELRGVVSQDQTSLVLPAGFADSVNLTQLPPLPVGTPLSILSSGAMPLPGWWHACNPATSASGLVHYSTVSLLGVPVSVVSRESSPTRASLSSPPAPAPATTSSFTPLLPPPPASPRRRGKHGRTLSLPHNTFPPLAPSAEVGGVDVQLEVDEEGESLPGLLKRSSSESCVVARKSEFGATELMVGEGEEEVELRKVRIVVGRKMIRVTIRGALALPSDPDVVLYEHKFKHIAGFHVCEDTFRYNVGDGEVYAFRTRDAVALHDACLAAIASLLTAAAASTTPTTTPTTPPTTAPTTAPTTTTPQIL